VPKHHDVEHISPIAITHHQNPCARGGSILFGIENLEMWNLKLESRGCRLVVTLVLSTNVKTLSTCRLYADGA
jgi:hypothetical protein